MLRLVARHVLEANGYRVLLIDTMMPVMVGPTILTLRHIQPNVRIIGAGCIEHNSMLARAADAGVKHFLPKPHAADVLLRTLAETLADQDKPVE